MNIGQIYNRTTWNAFGDSTPDDSVEMHMQSTFGIIADAHRKIQVDNDLWFMQASDTVPITAPDQEYALPTRFKREIVFRYLNSDGNYTEPLVRITQREAEINYTNPDTEEDYPLVYSVYGSYMYLHPKPKVDSTLYRKYYAFLERPSSVDDTDELTEHGAEVLIALSTIELLKTIHDLERISIYITHYKSALDTLLSLNNKRKIEELRGSASRYKLRYWDL